MGKKVVRTIFGAAATILTIGLVGIPAALALGSVPLASALSVVQALAFGRAVQSLLTPDLPALDGARNLAENLHIYSSPTAARQVIFGRAGVAGQVVFRETIINSGDTPNEVLLILALAGYPCDALERFWLNDTLVFDGDSTTGPGAITTGTFANDLWVWFRTGEETTAAFPEIASLSSTWNARTRRLRGICAIALRLRVTDALQGRLEPKAQVRGARVYDPRLDSTVPGGSGSHRIDDPSTWEFSTNPKLAEQIYRSGSPCPFE